MPHFIKRLVNILPLKSRLLTFSLLSLLLVLPLARVSYTPHVYDPSSAVNVDAMADNVGFEEQSQHTWEISDLQLALDIEMNETVKEAFEEEINMTKAEFDTLINEILAIPNDLQDSTLDMFVGKMGEDDFTQDIAMLMPSIRTAQAITIPKELFALHSDIDEEEAANLEFSFPAKSGLAFISPFAPFISPTMEMSSTPTMEKTILQTFRNYIPQDGSFDFLSENIPSNSPYAFLQPSPYGAPYPYKTLTEGAFIAPVPFTDVDANLSAIGELRAKQLGDIDGFTASYNEKGSSGKFTAKGEYSSASGLLGLGNATLDIETLTSNYTVGNGIMNRYRLDGSFTEQDEGGNQLSASFTFELTYQKGDHFHFQPSSGDTYGYTFGNATVPEGFFDALNGTLQGNLKLPEGISENTVEGLLQDTTLKLTCTGESFQGLGLSYNASSSFSGEQDSGRFISHPFGVSAPYVLPNWKLQLSYWQTHAHLSNKVLPKLLNSEVVRYDLLEFPKEADISINNEYALLSMLNKDWVSLKNDIDIQIRYNETIEGLSRFKTHITGQMWLTYTGSGFLTEIGLSLTVDHTYDSNEDGSLADEESEAFTFDFRFNRVENDATGNPDYTKEINPPDATSSEAGWKDVTPYKEEAGKDDDLLGDQPLLLVGAGIIGVVVIAGIIYVLKGRGKKVKPQ